MSKKIVLNSSVDISTFSQSFHWMNPMTTLKEVSRILKSEGVFAVYDCDWALVFNWEAELEYNILFLKVSEILRFLVIMNLK